MQPSSIIRHATDARRRLAGDWGLLFSHPEDFEEGGIERDRWIEMLRAAFREAPVLPLVLEPGHCEARTAWVWSIDSRNGYVGASFDPRDLSVRVAPTRRCASARAQGRGVRRVAAICVTPMRMSSIFWNSASPNARCASTFIGSVR